MNCNAEFLKLGPCSIGYKGKFVGVTLDSPLLNIEPDFYEARCNQIGGKVISKIVTNMNITVSAEVKEIDNAFADFFDVDGGITNVVFGEDVLTTGGELCLSPIADDDRVCYCFPKAVLIHETVYAYKNKKHHCLKMNFEVYEDLEGVLIQKFSQ
jgi:hypothetical protein